MFSSKEQKKKLQTLLEDGTWRVGTEISKEFQKGTGRAGHIFISSFGVLSLIALAATVRARPGP